MLKSSKNDESNINAFLGQSTNFNGSLVFDGLVRIDGSFEGKIKTSDTLIIANSGKVKAEIEAGVVKISGSFEGNIVAKTKVELLKPSVVEGTITTPCIAVEDGVIFNGTCVMSVKEGLKEMKK